MEDKYFENLFNEGSMPFPEFISQLDSYQPIRLFEDDLLLNSPISFISSNELPVSPLILNISQPDDQDESESSNSIEKNTEEITITDNISEDKVKFVHKTKSGAIIKKEDKKQARAEKNRKYARESRERKKKYIEELKNEIRKLKLELDTYKAKYKNYEILEECKTIFCKNMYTELLNAYKEVSEKDGHIGSKMAFVQKTNNSLKRLLEKQKDALSTLGKILVDIALPLPTRIFCWLAENKIENSKPDEILEKLKPVTDLKLAQVVIDYAKQLDPDGEKEKELNGTIAESFKRTKEALKEIISQVRVIHAECEIRIKYMNNNVLPYLTPYVVEILASTVAQIVTKSEIGAIVTNQLMAIISTDNGADKSPVVT